MKRFFALALLVLAAPAAAQAVNPARARRVYEESCAPCHGEQGDGKGPAADWLEPKPRDFTRGLYKLRSTKTGAPPTDADLVAVIGRGIPGTSMPAWRQKLTPAEIAALVPYIEAFSPRFAKPRVARPLPPAHPDSPAVRREGQALYRLLRCWDCHGPGGRGDGPSAATTKDDQGRRIRPGNLTARLRAGDGVVAIYRVLDGGMDGTPMPSFADAMLLSRESLADVTPLVAVFGSAAAAELGRFVARLPDQDAIDKLDDAGRAALTAERLWALAYYVQSLRSRSTADYLFSDQAGRYEVP